MAFSIGHVLKGCRASYKIIKPLKLETVYQAKVISSHQIPTSGPQSSELVVIKHEPRPDYKVAFTRELDSYSIKRIKDSPCFRKLRDLIDVDKWSERNSDDSESKELEMMTKNECMVFEWMDTDLWQLPSEPFRSGSSPLPRIVARSLLEALVVLEELGGVHSDLNPNNVFLSNACDSQPVVKLGDLGKLVGQRESTFRFQGIYIRAPEVWRGVGMYPRSDVWSLGVTLAHWMVSNILFGPSYKIIEGMTEACCLANMIRLVGPLEKPVAPEYEEEFDIARGLANSTFTNPVTGLGEQYIKLGTVRQELEKVSGSKIEKGCIDFIESLLVVDHTKRPSAREALEHPWLRELGA